MYYDDDYDYEMYDDIYEDEAIIEAALDIYDEYEVSMEEAIDIAMEKVYISPGRRDMKKLEEENPHVNCENSDEYWLAKVRDLNFLRALRHAKNGGNATPNGREDIDFARKQYGDFGYNRGKKYNRKIKFKDKVIDRGNPTPEPEPTPSAPTPTRSEPTPSAPTPTPIKRRINPRTGIAVGAGAAALVAGGVALYKYRKKKLAEAAKAQREAEKEEAKAAMKREEAEDAVAQAKEAASYFAY